MVGYQKKYGIVEPTSSSREPCHISADHVEGDRMGMFMEDSSFKPRRQRASFIAFFVL
jgi:hypothetical protein